MSGFNAAKFQVLCNLAVARMKFISNRRESEIHAVRKEVAALLSKNRLDSARIKVWIQ